MLPDEDVATIEKNDADTGAEDNDAVEAEARSQGWRPKVEYDKLKDADPKKWVDAATFLERGEKSLPIIKSQLRESQAQIREMKALVRDVLKNQQADREKAIAEAIAKLKADKSVAVSEGDAKKVDALDTQIDALKAAPKPKEEAQTSNDMPEEFKTWAKANPWFGKDPTLRGLAIGHYDLLCADDETADLSDTEKLKLVKAEVQRRYPEKFANPKRKEAPVVESGDSAPRNGGGKKGYGDLPREAQDMCARLIKTKVLPNREAYLTTYQW